jgi:hypothetical protein
MVENPIFEIKKNKIVFFRQIRYLSQNGRSGVTVSVFVTRIIIRKKIRKLLQNTADPKILFLGIFN